MLALLYQIAVALKEANRWAALTHPRTPPARLPPPPPPLPSHRTTCLNFPAVASNGTSLVVNDGSGRRFFTAGMVKSESSGLLGFNRSHFEALLIDSVALGANTLRWNAFLKGLDFEWAAIDPAAASAAAGSGEEVPRVVVHGLRAGCLDALSAGLDLAQRHGIMVQIALSTAHFLRYGYGGEGTELHGITNRDRVANCWWLLATSTGTAAYVHTVLNPILNRLGRHPALLGFLIVNEGYSMVRKEDTVLTRTSDATIPLVALQAFINRVAGHIRRVTPGVLPLASLPLMAFLPFPWSPFRLMATFSSLLFPSLPFPCGLLMAPGA